MPIPEDLEETGVGIRRNGDDDDNDNIADRFDVNVAGEDDLIRVTMETGNRSMPGVRFELNRSTTDINVWRSATSNTNAIFDLSPTNLSTVLPATGPAIEDIYVEWANMSSTASTSLKLSVWDTTHNQEVFFDTVVFDPFKSIVIVLGGENQVPADPVNFPGDHGIFDMAIDIYRNDGYDVFMYDEDDSNTQGVGAPYDEIVEAINNRGVTEVAIIGYSHGGGSTYSLSWRLNENVIGNLTDITGTFTVPYTAYIDAVTDWTGSPENRRPHLSLFHTNQYERNTWGNLPGLPHGGPAGGDDDIDRSYIVGINHFNIDDDPLILSFTHTRLKQKVPTK
ncbi:MAG: hypothetical protein COA78_09695 [Blastopirellula sp.]|nr:MAG: hypothetical protein COA78_09695 [Blastopirellula sp.]